MTTRTQKTKVVISAKDEASAELKKIQKNFKYFSKSASHLGSELKKLGAITSLPIAGAIASAGGIVKNAVSSMVDYGSAVDNTSKNLSIASDSLQAFRYAAEQSGSSASEMDGAIAMLNRNMANAAQGKNKDLVALMNHLGISMKDANGNMKDAASLMPEVADAISRQTDATQRAYIATQFFGRSGQGLIKTLKDGSAGLEAQRKEAEKFGIVMSKEAVEAATLFGDSMTRTQYAIQGVQNSIGEKLLPTLQPMLDDMNDWIAENREWFATAITDGVKDLAESLKDLDIKSVVNGFVGLVKASFNLFNALGGLKTIGIAIASIYGIKVVGSIISTGSAIIGLGKALIPLLPALGGATAAVWSFTAALLANPITWVVAGVAALAGAVYLIYKNWEPISDFFTKVWDGIKGAFDWYIDYLKTAWNTICDLPSVLKKAFEGLGKWFGEVWEGVKASFFAPFEAAYNKISGAFSTVGNVAGKAWDSVTGFFGGDSDVELSPRQQMALSGSISPIGGTDIISSENKSEVVVRLLTDENTHAEVESSRTTSSSLRTSVNLGETR